MKKESSENPGDKERRMKLEQDVLEMTKQIKALKVENNDLKLQKNQQKTDL